MGHGRRTPRDEGRRRVDVEAGHEDRGPAAIDGGHRRRRQRVRGQGTEEEAFEEGGEGHDQEDQAEDEGRRGFGQRRGGIRHREGFDVKKNYIETEAFTKFLGIRLFGVGVGLFVFPIKLENEYQILFPLRTRIDIRRCHLLGS